MANEEAGAGAGNGQDGNGAPSGGSSEDGSENALDERFEKRIRAALANQARQYESRIESVRAEFDAFKAGAGSKKDEERQQPKRYTRTEFKAAVDAGQITQEQADDRWAQQVREEAREDAVAAATAAVRGGTQKERVDSEISRYRQLKPEIMQRGSDTRNQVTDEYKALVDRGSPENVATELAAIRAVLGPLDKLEKSAQATRSQESDEQGGGDSRPKGGTGKNLVDKLDARAKKHYEKGIEQGRYKDWKEVESELKFATPKRRQELGLPA